MELSHDTNVVKKVSAPFKWWHFTLDECHKTTIVKGFVRATAESAITHPLCHAKPSTYPHAPIPNAPLPNALVPNVPIPNWFNPQCPRTKVVYLLPPCSQSLPISYLKQVLEPAYWSSGVPFFNASSQIVFTEPWSFYDIFRCNIFVY